jgi:hypothetical protein
MAPRDSHTMAQDFARDGAFASIATYVEKGEIDKGIASAFVSQVFRMYREKIKEGKKELAHLSAALDRLERAAQAGSHPRPYIARDPTVLSLAHEITVFDGWVMSLYETDLSMIWWGAPARAKEKPNEMARAVNELFVKRLKEMDFNLRDTSLFRIG